MAKDIETTNWGHAWRPVGQGEKVNPEHILERPDGTQLIPARLYPKPMSLNTTPDLPMQAQDISNKLPSNLGTPISNP